MARKHGVLASFRRPCSTCGGDFLVRSPANGKRPQARFCSLLCKYRWKGLRRNIEQRFWQRVKKTSGCWLWTGFILPTGYGAVVGPDGKRWLAHRLAWWLVHHERPELHVLHSCDTPACVSPNHLFLGTQRDNMFDMHAKGRAGVKLSDSQVQAIRLRYRNTSCSQRDLARDYGVTQAQIHNIVARKQRVTV